MNGIDLRVKGLSVACGAIAVGPIDLEIAAGECVSLLGPPGAGRSTLLRTLAGFLAPSLGRIAMGGVDVTEAPPERRPSQLVPAGLALFPHLDVGANVAFGLEARDVAPDRRRARAADLLAVVGVPGAAERRPGDLAPAERVRVALARALAVDPGLLLLDDPFAGLDAEARRRLRTDLRTVRRHTGATVLFATDERAEALALSDRVAVMNRGRIEQIDPPDRVFSSPATAFVARFLGEPDVLPGRVAAMRGERVTVTTAVGRILATAARPLAVGDAVEVMIRPERLMLDRDRALRDGEAADPEEWNRLRADLVGRTLEGPVVAYDFAIGDTRLVMHRPNLGPQSLLLASLHAIGFHADDALVFPASPEADDG